MRDAPIDIGLGCVFYNNSNGKWKIILTIINMATLWKTSS